MSKKPVPLLMRLFGAGVGLGIAFILQLGVLFWIVFGAVGWIYIAPKIHEGLK